MVERSDAMGDQLVPSEVLERAADELDALGRAGLAEEVRRVTAYVRRLAVTQTEIAALGDTLVERADGLLQRPVS